MRRLVLFSGILFLAVPAGAATYYFSDCQAGAEAACVPGDDAGAGTSPGDPWRSLARAAEIANNLQAGDQILFARGGTFSGANIRFSNPFSLRDNPIVVADYAPPWATASSGRPVMAGGPMFEFAGGEGYVVRNLDFRGTGTPGSFCLFAHNDLNTGTVASDILLENLAMDGYDLAVFFGREDELYRATLRNSTITNCTGMGFLGGGTGILLENNVFDNNGDEPIFEHNVYVANATNFIVRDNDIHRAAMVDGECQGTSFVAHGRLSGVVIEGNVVREDLGAAGGGCYGISVVVGGYPGVAEDFRGTVIRGNRVINVGARAIGVVSCPDCVIENNVIIQEQPSVEGAIGIIVPDREHDADDAADDNVTVRNNSIYFNNGQQNIGIAVGGEGTSHVVVGNVVSIAGAAAGSSCLQLDLPPSSYEAVDNNLCRFADSAGGPWELSRGFSLAQWQAASGLDAHSLEADPLYQSPGSPAFDLSVPAGSPVVDAGHPSLSPPTDITGRARDASPDMGAYEFAGSGVAVPGAPTGLRIGSLLGALLCVKPLE